MGWLIGLIFSLLMTFGGIVSYSMEKKVEELVVVVIFVLLDICCIKKYRDKKTGKTAEKKQKKKDSKEMLSRMITGKHQAGLPLSQDTSCEITVENDCFKISGGGNVFELKKNKITDIAVKTDAEIQKQYVSSIGGAVAGGMVFGPLGAIVGGRAKEKKTTTITYYLIFTYRSKDEIDYASFEIPFNCFYKAQKWRKDFQNQATSNDINNSIEL